MAIARYELRKGREKQWKFWEVEATGKTVRTRAGALGSAGRSTTKTYASTAAADDAVGRMYLAKLEEGYRGVIEAPEEPVKPMRHPVRKGFEKSRALSRGGITAGELKQLVANTVKGKFAQSSLRRVALSEIEDRVEFPAEASTEILVHDGNLKLPDLVTYKRPPLRMLIVLGDLTITGRFEDARDPEMILVVTGDLRCGDLITEGFLEVHGDVVATRSAVFLDIDCCAEIFGDLRAPFVYTMYHAVNVHGRVVAKLATGDAKHIRSKHAYEFVREDEYRVGERLSPELRKALGGSLDDPEQEFWVDYVSSEPLRRFVARGGNPLASNRRRP